VVTIIQVGTRYVDVRQGGQSVICSINATGAFEAVPTVRGVCKLSYTYYTNVVDRHVLMLIRIRLPFKHRSRSGSDPDPIPKFYKRKKIFLIHSSAGINCFTFLVSVIGVKIFCILDSILKFSGKKYSLALYLVKLDRAPDPLIRLDPDPRHCILRLDKHPWISHVREPYREETAIIFIIIAIYDAKRCKQKNKVIVHLQNTILFNRSN